MKKFIFLLIFCGLSYAQTSTEKWNSLYERYEYFDSNGTMIGYKKYNKLYERWEYYDLKSNNSSSTPQPSFGDLELAKKALAEKQARYDANTLKVKNQISIVFQNIDYLVLKLMTDSPQELDYKYANYLKALFQKEFIKIIESKTYDYSYNSTTEQVLSYLKNGSIFIVKRELAFINDKDKTHYQYLINEFSKL